MSSLLNRYDYPACLFKGWLWVTTPDENQGWAPIPYLKIEAGNRAIATQDYTAVELDTCIGDALHLHYELNGWGWVEKEDGACGWVPMKTMKFALP